MKIPSEENMRGHRNLLIVGGLFLASFLLMGLGVILFEIHAVNFSENLIIHFDFFQGITFLGDLGWVYRTFFLAGLIEVLNFSLAWFFMRRQLFLAYLFAVATLLFSVLIFTALLVIITVN